MKDSHESLAERAYSASKADIFTFRSFSGDRFSEEEVSYRLKRSKPRCMYPDPDRKRECCRHAGHAGVTLDMSQVARLRGQWSLRICQIIENRKMITVLHWQKQIGRTRSRCGELHRLPSQLR